MQRPTANLAFPLVRPSELSTSLVEATVVAAHIGRKESHARTLRVAAVQAQRDATASRRKLSALLGDILAYKDDLSPGEMSMMEHCAAALAELDADMATTAEDLLRKAVATQRPEPEAGTLRPRRARVDWPDQPVPISDGDDAA